MPYSHTWIVHSGWLHKGGKEVAIQWHHLLEQTRCCSVIVISDGYTGGRESRTSSSLCLIKITLLTRGHDRQLCPHVLVFRQFSHSYVGFQSIWRMRLMHVCVSEQKKREGGRGTCMQINSQPTCVRIKRRLSKWESSRCDVAVEDTISSSVTTGASYHK